MASRSQKAAGNDNSAHNSQNINLFIAKREAIFEYMQSLYDLSSNIHTDASERERFLDKSSNIDSLRSEFMQALDDYNSCLLLANANAKPDYKSLISFESLYSRIKRLQTKYDKTTTQGQEVILPKSKVTLPPINLVNFSGDIRSWPLFYASFKSTVHDNSSLTDSEKLYYLLGKLSGDAQLVCSSISPCPENYNIILQTLIDKYEDKRMLASTYIDQLFDFQCFRSATANNFDLFINNFVTAVLALRNLNLDNLTDFIILHIALKKLDTDTACAFDLNCTSKMPTFDELVEFIKRRAKVLGRKHSASSITDSARRNNINQRKNIASPPQYQTYINTTVDSHKKCLCTNISHQHLFKCISFNRMTPQERYKCVKENNACINCLSLFHKISNCSSKIKCRVCNYT